MDEEHRVNDALKAAGFDFALRIRPVGKLNGADKISEPDARQAHPGVFYRAPLPYRISVEQAPADGSGTPAIVTESIFFSENGAPIQFLDINRSMFVKRTTEISFSYGLPSSVDITKPSEAEALTQLPLDITKAIVQIPADAITGGK